MYQGSRKRRTSAFSLGADNQGFASGSLPGAASSVPVANGSNRKHGLSSLHLQRGKAAQGRTAYSLCGKSIGCVRDSEEITCYPWAASSLLRRVEEPFLTLGKQCFADVEEVLLKQLCVFILTLHVNIHIFTCMLERIQKLLLGYTHFTVGIF